MNSRKLTVPSNAPVNENTTCQRCLQKGHWTADCKNQPVYKSRPSRSALLYNNASLGVKPKTAEPEETGNFVVDQYEEERRKVLEQVLGREDLSESDFSDH